MENSENFKINRNLVSHKMFEFPKVLQYIFFLMVIRFTWEICIHMNTWLEKQSTALRKNYRGVSILCVIIFTFKTRVKLNRYLASPIKYNYCTIVLKFQPFIMNLFVQRWKDVWRASKQLFAPEKANIRGK